MTKLPSTLLPGSLLVALALAGCSDPVPPAGGDLSMDEQDMRRMPGDLAAVRCELPFEQRLIDMVSTGQVSVTSMTGVYTAKVDASAGGFDRAVNNPYVYLDLINQKKVDITDVKAQESRDWDIGLKRYVIKVNSGDSGPGGVTVKVVPDKTLEEVMAAPAGTYQEDEYIDEKCTIYKDQIEGLSTAMSEWYDYNGNTMVLSPRKQTYVLKRRDGKGAIKLQVTGYYEMVMGRNVSGMYTLRWAFLP